MFVAISLMSKWVASDERKAVSGVKRVYKNADAPRR